MARMVAAQARAGVLPHVGFSLGAVVIAAAALVAAVQIWGDASDAGPSVTLALPPPPAAPAARTREVVLGAAPDPSLPVADLSQAAPEAGEGPVRISIGLPPNLGPAPVTGGAVRVIAPGQPGTAPGRRAKGPPLPPAPIAGLVQQSPQGPLPAPAADGRTPLQAYARPFAGSGRPRVALVVGGLGLNAAQTERALADLPPEVTLAFVPYADNLQGWINRARAAGHEVLIEAPMEPFDYPDNDPGPHTLLSAAPADENLRRLEFVLSRAQGYVGVINYLGAKFAGAPAADAVFQALQRRGLAFVSDGTARGFTANAGRANTPFLAADRVIDARPSAGQIEDNLAALEAAAKQRGGAVGVAAAYPVSVDQIAAWAAGLSARGVELAPASALVRRPA